MVGSESELGNRARSESVCTPVCVRLCVARACVCARASPCVRAGRAVSGLTEPLVPRLQPPGGRAQPSALLHRISGKRVRISAKQ